MHWAAVGLLEELGAKKEENGPWWHVAGRPALGDGLWGFGDLLLDAAEECPPDPHCLLVNDGVRGGDRAG